MVRTNIAEATAPELSKSIQMYLVTIARLHTAGQPVPLSQLAQALTVSPVSVNEMCRKLQDQGLVAYRPYKGASLTPDGEQLAYGILRHHRLWEVFLVEKLGFEYTQAHEAACQLEHATSDAVADRLDVFLGRPAVSPLGQPIPRVKGDTLAHFLRPLAALSAGQRGHVIRRDMSDTARSFLDERGVRPGATLTVEAVAEDGVLVQVSGTHISLGRALAEAVQVEPQEMKTRAAAVTPLPSSVDEGEAKMQEGMPTSVAQVPLHELKVGQRGIVVHVKGKGPVKRRMMDMGLVPGTEVKVVRVAPLGDPVEFELKGYRLSLRKSEARNIIVEAPEEVDG